MWNIGCGTAPGNLVLYPLSNSFDMLFCLQFWVLSKQYHFVFKTIASIKGSQIHETFPDTLDIDKFFLVNLTKLKVSKLF